MRDVDEFLDRLTEVVTGLTEENARLRRQAGAAPVVGSPDLDDVARQADEIIQRARDEAARIDTEARARASLSTAPAVASEGDRAAVKAFLAQERAFLESLAGLLQGHAETMKVMARDVRRSDRPSTEDPDAPAAPTEPVARDEPPPAAVTRGDPPAGPDTGHDPIAHVEAGSLPQILDRPDQVARDPFESQLGRDLELERDGDAVLARDAPPRHHLLRELDLVGLERHL